MYDDWRRSARTSGTAYSRTEKLGRIGRFGYRATGKDETELGAVNRPLAPAGRNRDHVHTV